MPSFFIGPHLPSEATLVVMVEMIIALFIVAHRGASELAPENTLPAFELAWQLGADAIEGDFLLSKDGHIVCIHDSDTKKLAGKNWKSGGANLGRAQDSRRGELEGQEVRRHPHPHPA